MTKGREAASAEDARARFVYVDDDGTVRELTPAECRYLATPFEPSDSGRPYIKERFGARTPDKRLGGFLERWQLLWRFKVKQLAPARAVLFDVGNTLLKEQRYDLHAGIAAVVKDPARAAALAATFQAQTVARHQRDEEVLLARWLLDEGVSVTSESLPALEDRIWNAVVTLVPTPGVEEVLAQLSDDGIPIAAVSNAAFSSRVLRAELDRHGLADSLRFVMTSADSGVRKPAAAIFARAVEQLGVPPHECWFVGDTFDQDITGARAAGLQPILFAPRTAPAFDVPIVHNWEDFIELYAWAREDAHTR